MTPRAEAYLHVLIAYGFAMTCVEKGYTYKRQESLLGKTLIYLKPKLNEKQLKQIEKEFDRFVAKNPNMTPDDFIKHIEKAIHIIKQGRERRPNSWLALAKSNVQINIESEEELSETKKETSRTKIKNKGRDRKKLKRTKNGSFSHSRKSKNKEEIAVCGN